MNHLLRGLTEKIGGLVFYKFQDIPTRYVESLYAKIKISLIEVKHLLFAKKVVEPYTVTRRIM